MGKTYTVEELEKCSKEELMRMLLAMQDQMERMNGNLENLIEQIRIANQQKFGRHTEKLEAMEGQLSFFNEAEYLSEEDSEEEAEDILPKKPRNKKQEGKQEADLKDFPYAGQTFAGWRPGSARSGFPGSRSSAPSGPAWPGACASAPPCCTSPVPRLYRFST